MNGKRILNPARILAIGFPAIAVAGALLLMLPVSTVEGVGRLSSKCNTIR